MLRRFDVIDTLFIIQKVVDLSIPACLLFAFTPIAFGLVNLPPTIAALFHNETFALLWALSVCVSLIGIVIGTIMKGRSNSSGIPQKDTYLFFEYPGLIAASLLIAVYGFALLLLPSAAGLAAGGQSLAIAFYFLFRYLRTKYTIQVAKAKVSRTRR